MKNLFIKVHPRYLAWYAGDEFGTIILQNNLLKNYEEIKKLFFWLKGKDIGSKVFFENPHIQLTGNLINVRKDIQHIQRLVGVLQVLCWEVFTVDPFSLVPYSGLNMQQKIDLFDTTFNTPLYYNALEKMCVVECLLLEKSL